MSNVKQQQELTFRNIHITGIDHKLFHITIRNGRFTSIEEAEPVAIPESERLWIAPGLIDLHTHLAWTDFHHDDQLKRDASEVEAMQADAFKETLAVGVTTVRDAGGLQTNTINQIKDNHQSPIKVYTSGTPLSAADAKGIAHLDQRIHDIVASGATWIKIFATGGLGATPERVIDPFFSQEELSFIVRKARELNVKVLVHAWGGSAIDASIEAGVDSIEHGIYLTENQAYRMADSGMILVPTARIYQIAADPHGALQLNDTFRYRAARAADAHAKAIGYAKQAGVRIGWGTDFSTPMLNGRNLEEFDTLIEYGLTREEAWHGATELAAELLGFGDKLGAIKTNYIADAVIYNRDPLKVSNAEQLKSSIVSVHTGY